MDDDESTFGWFVVRFVRLEAGGTTILGVLDFTGASLADFLGDFSVQEAFLFVL